MADVMTSLIKSLDMKNMSINKIRKLADKGVKFSNPETIEISDEVDIERISGNGVRIYSGCRIFGRNTYISHNARLGYEGPLVVDNCQMGPSVDLKGGFLKDAVFLENTSMGNGAYVRGGTILEENASCAHTVGLKQTILFPFVTLGSLINFCDCFMSGGTGKKNHSEIGSSYVHFNFTPNQDKATPSLIGDVPRGVMLNQLPVFLGGQGGLVGPCRLGFGIVIAAGSVWRKDELRNSRLLMAGKTEELNLPYFSGAQISYKRIIKNNIIYIANLIALSRWYADIRSMFVSEDFPEPLLYGLKKNISVAVLERIEKLEIFFCKIREITGLSLNWNKVAIYFKNLIYKENAALRETFMGIISSCIEKKGNNYLSVIKGLENKERAAGTMWLQGIVDEIADNLLEIIYNYE